MARTREAADVRAAKGDTGHRAEKPRVEDAVAAADAAPPWLKNEVARAIWVQMNRDMSSSNLIKKADGNAFGRYCAYMAEWVELDRKLREMGEVIYETDTRHGKMQRIHPLFNARDRTESNLIKLEEQLGLTPRARIAILAHLSGQQPSLPGLGDEPAIAAQRDEDDSIGFLAGAHRPN